MNRRIAIQALLVQVVSAMLAMANPVQAGVTDLVKGVFGNKADEKLIVVQVDVTGSIGQEEWQLYERAYGEVLKALKPGDRIVVSAIGDKPASKFSAVRDETVRRSGIRLQDDAAFRALSEHLKADFNQLHAQSTKPAQATYILDAISATDQIFSQGRAQQRKLIYLILSDMIEESPVANFAKSRIDGASTTHLLEDRRKRGLLPDLSGVNVYVVGAGGRNAEQMTRIQHFWSAYFAATHATLKDYGRNPSAIDP